MGWENIDKSRYRDRAMTPHDSVQWNSRAFQVNLMVDSKKAEPNSSNPFTYETSV